MTNMDHETFSPTELVAESSLFSVLPGEAQAAVTACLRPQWVDDGAYQASASRR